MKNNSDLKNLANSIPLPPKVPSNDPFSILSLSSTFHTLISLKNFKKNSIVHNSVSSFSNSTPDYINRFTIQCDKNTHILLKPHYLQYINHSCNPNVFFDFPNSSLIALSDINIEDELRFFYPSTEWVMSEPFNCNCGSKTCIGQIKGGKYIDNTTASQHKLTNHIIELRKELN